MNKPNNFVVSALVGALVALGFLRSCGIPIRLTDAVSAVFAHVPSFSELRSMLAEVRSRDDSTRPR